MLFRSMNKISIEIVPMIWCQLQRNLDDVGQYMGFFLISTIYGVLFLSFVNFYAIFLILGYKALFP